MATFSALAFQLAHDVYDRKRAHAWLDLLLLVEQLNLGPCLFTDHNDACLPILKSYASKFVSLPSTEDSHGSGV